jgi:ABC-type sulfate transport system permease component
MIAAARKSALPGFAAILGVTTVWLLLGVLILLAALVLRPWELGVTGGFWHSIADPRVLAALRRSFGAAALAAAVNAPVGLLIAWVRCDTTFPAADSLINMPLALPTAVAGIALTALCARRAGSAHCSPAGCQGCLHAAGNPAGATRGAAVAAARRGARRGAVARTRRRLTALDEPDAIAAIELTLIVAAVAVPLNTVRGLVAVWCIGRYVLYSWLAVSGIPIAKTTRAIAAVAPNVRKVAAYPK